MAGGLGGIRKTLGSPVVPFCPLFGVSLLIPNIRKKGPLIIKGLLGNRGKEEQPRLRNCADQAQALLLRRGPHISATELREALEALPILLCYYIRLLLYLYITILVY